MCPCPEPLHLGLGARASPNFFLVGFTPHWGVPPSIRPRWSRGDAGEGDREHRCGGSLAALPPGGDRNRCPPLRQLRQKLELSREPGRSGSARALEARLREAEGEIQRLRGALEKKTQELQRSLQE